MTIHIPRRLLGLLATGILGHAATARAATLQYVKVGILTDQSGPFSDQAGPGSVVAAHMAAEDFAYYSQVADACFYRMGTRSESRGITSAVHTPTFDIEETALEQSVGLMAYLAIKQLGN